MVACLFLGNSCTVLSPALYYMDCRHKKAGKHLPLANMFTPCGLLHVLSLPKASTASAARVMLNDAWERSQPSIEDMDTSLSRRELAHTATLVCPPMHGLLSLWKYRLLMPKCLMLLLLAAVAECDTVFKPRKLMGCCAAGLFCPHMMLSLGSTLQHYLLL